MALSLTDEQKHAVDLAVNASGNLKIEAFAGTGKTSTLKAISEACYPKRCLYIVFNADIAKESRGKFPDNVSCRTSHSLAFEKFGKPYSDSGRLRQKLNGHALAKMLGIYEFHGIGGKTLSALALETIRLFCHSSSQEMTQFHIPQKALAALQVVSDAEAVAARILEIAKLTWQHMLNPTSDLPITHDFYLKLWALSKPVINADLVMLDEGQDANGLLLKILEEQQCQVIYVGDQYQQLYSWRGAVNAMQRVKTPNVASLTQSFRFGPAIAEVANEVLVKMLGSERQIRGNPAKASRVESVRNPKAILCRTNAECIRQVIAAIDDGRRVGLQGGTADFKLTIQGIEDLKRGRVPYAPTLSLFISYDQLVEFSKSDLGRDLQTAIKLADEYGGQELLRLIEKLESSKESKPDIIISTGHKAKGLEWETVRLGSDFRGSDSKGYKDEDANLLYVAVTRAIGTLDLSLCDAIDQLRESKPSRATMPEDDSVIVLTREALAGIYEKPSARIEPILEVGPTSDGQAELGLMRTTVELQPSHPGFDGLTQNDPSIVQKNPGQGSQARRRQLEGARADAARDFLLRAKRDGRDQILKSSAGDAWGGLEQADTEDALNTWMERFLSEPGRQRMMATLRQAAFAANMKKVDLKSTVANRLSQAAREKGVSISDYIEQLLEIQGSGLPVSPGETSQGDRELSLQSY